MTHSSQSVANKVITYCKENGINDLTHTKLQKLVYLCHAFNLAVYDKPMIDKTHTVFAYKYGPVIYTLFKDITKLKLKMGTNIDKLLKIKWNDLYTEDEENLIQEVMNVFGNYSAGYLVAYTHEEGSPWDSVYDENADNPFTVIPDKLTKNHYEKQITKS